MPFNPSHLLNGIAFAHALNGGSPQGVNLGANPPQGMSNTPSGGKQPSGNQPLNASAKGSQPQFPPEAHAAMQKLHQTLLAHHLNEMTKHAKAVHILTGGKA